MDQMKNMTFNTMDKKMQLVANAFFASKKKKNRIHRLSDSEKIFDYERYQSFIERVKSIYSCLSIEEKIFINNEYFYEEYPYWWLGIYTKREFKKNKKKAVMHFLRLFYEE